MLRINNIKGNNSEVEDIGGHKRSLISGFVTYVSG